MAYPQDQNFPIVFNQGLDQKSDHKQTIPGKMLVLQNASIGKSPGEYVKRDGFVGLTQVILGGGSIASGVGIGSFKNELVTLDGSSLYSYSPNAAAQVNKGPLVPTTLSVQSIARNNDALVCPDSAYHSGTGLQCFSWIDSQDASAHYSIIDSITGAQIVTNGLISKASKAKVITIGVYFVIVYFDQIDTKIKYVAINTATPNTVSAAVTIATDISSSFPCFDAAVINGSIYVAYDIGSTKLGFYSLSNLLVLSSQYTITISKQVQNAITIVGDGSNNVWCFYSVNVTTNESVYGTVVNAALNSTLLAPTLVQSGINGSGFETYNMTAIVSGTTATVYWEQTYIQSNYISSNTLTFAGVAGTTVVVMYRMGLASKVFLYNGVRYLLGCYGGDFVGAASVYPVGVSIEATYFLLNVSAANNPQVVTKIAPSLAAHYYSIGMLPEVIPMTATNFEIPYLIQDDLSSLNGNVFFKTGVMSAQINFALSSPMAKLQLGENLHFSAGQLWAYDSANIVEQGFHIYPENISVSNHTSGGGIGSSLNSGPINQIQYAAVYEYQDNQGQLHQSNPSPFYSYQLPNTVSAITFTATSATNTNTLTSVSSFTGLVVGQVLTDSTSAGTLPAGTYIIKLEPSFNRITLSENATASNIGDTYSTKDILTLTVTIPTLTATYKNLVSIVLYRTENNQPIFYRVSSLNSLTYNIFTAETITISDSLPDSQIVGNEQLYTTGGTKGNINAPSVSALCPFKSRMIYLSPENPFQIGYSQQIIDGVPVQFNSLQFVKNIDQTIGRAVAVSPIDDKLVIFGPSNKFYMVGTGPSPDGQNDDFTDPSPIVGVSGCSNPNAVLELPNGIIYQDSQKGWYLLDRSLQEHYIGADVEQFNQYPATSCQKIPNSTKVTLTLSNGTNLTYDYFVGQWETDLFPGTVFDSTIFENDLVYIQSNGLSLQQTPSVYSDNGSVIPFSIKTGSLNLAQIQGFQRVYEVIILGTYFSPHTLTVNLYTDFGTSPTTTRVIPVLVQPNIYEYRIRPSVMKCTSMQIEIIESQSGSPGQGLSLSGISLRVAVKKGQNKLSAGASY